MSFFRKRNISSIGDYWVGESLGEGTYASVAVGVHKTTHKRVALKIIPATSARFLAPKQQTVENDTSVYPPLLRERIELEVQILESLKGHANIVQFIELIEIPKDNSLCVVLECVEGGDLFDYVFNSGRLEETKAAKLFQQIASATQFCHSKQIAHRDIKLENIFVDPAHSQAKLGDFGLSTFFSPNGTLRSSCGSPIYASPEIMNNQPYTGPEVDIWALGVLLYCMVTGCLPWAGDNITQQMEAALKGSFVVPSEISKECAQLIKRMLVVRPQDRATLPEILSSEWLVKHSNRKPKSISFSERGLLPFSPSRSTMIMNLWVSAFPDRTRPRKFYKRIRMSRNSASKNREAATSFVSKTPFGQPTILNNLSQSRPASLCMDS